jgi:hypothetical protein
MRGLTCSVAFERFYRVANLVDMARQSPDRRFKFCKSSPQPLKLFVRGKNIPSARVNSSNYDDCYLTGSDTDGLGLFADKSLRNLP